MFLLTPGICILAFHLWLIAHAKDILADVVQRQSGGRYTLSTEGMKYDYLKLRLELDKPMLINTNNKESNDRFELNARLITIQLEKLWPLIAGRELLIDSIFIDHPDLNLVHQKRANNIQQKTAFSLSLEMEKLYQSIQSVLTTLKVSNFRVNKGLFTLNKTSSKSAFPFEIKDIDFYIKGFNIDSATVSQHPNSYTEDIQLKIPGQTIHFPDGDKSIQFSNFRFDAGRGNLEVDSCSMSGGENDSTRASFRLFAEKMRIKNVFVAGNDSSDYNRIDSLFFTRPKVSLSFQIKSVRQDSSESIAIAVRKITSAAFGRLLVRYMSINNVDFDIDVERKEKVSTFNFVQDSLVMSNLGIGLFPSMPLSASSIRFGVKEFVDYFRDSTYLVHFDSVRINNDQFSLFNTRIESTARVKKGSQKISIPELQIKDIDWYQLITQKKLVASNFTLQSPAISVMAAGESKARGSRKGNSVEEQLKQTLELKKISIVNGSVNYTFPGNGYVNITGVNTYLQPDLSMTDLAKSLPRMVHDLNGNEVTYARNGWKMIARKLAYKSQGTLSADDIEVTNNQRSLNLRAKDVDIEGMSDIVTTGQLKIKKIKWQTATVNMNTSQNEKTKGNSTLAIGDINGGPTDLKINTDSTRIEARITKITTGNVYIEDGKPRELGSLSMEGSRIDIKSLNNNFHSDKFFIRDKSASFFSGFSANILSNKSTVAMTASAISFKPDIQNSLASAFELDSLRISKPSIEITLNPGGRLSAPAKRNIFPRLNIHNILIDDPDIKLHDNKSVSPIKFIAGTSSLAIAEIKTVDDSRQLQLGDIHVQLNNFLLEKDSMRIQAINGGAKGATKEIILSAAPASKNASWKLSDGMLDLSNITFLNKRPSGEADTLQLSTLHAENIFMDENSLANTADYFNLNPAFKFQNINLAYRNRKARILVRGLKGNSNSLSVDSFAYHPKAGRVAFMSAQEFQKDYITLESGPVFFDHIDAASWLRDSTLKVGHIRVSQAILNDTLDKHLPLQPDIIKGLPVTIIKAIPFKTMIDSITINDSRVRYHEISEKTNQTGNIRFTKLNAMLQHIKNYGFLADDSLQVEASGYLMDSALIQLRMKESYDDSLATFPLVVKISPFDLKVLNPFLLPVMSVKIKSGVADSVYVRAVAREYLSLGEMLFYYHNLKVEFLKADSDQKKTILTSLLTFAANSFVIRTKNTKRLGKIYYERSRNRSFFNYLVRMVASGAASSVGAKRNAKYNRLYNEKIQELNLPRINY